MVFAVVIGTCLGVRWPAYRIERSNVIELLQMAVDGRVSENDWSVVVSIPLRRDPYLEEIRQRCTDVEARTDRGTRRSGALFSESGLEELREILAELQASG